MRFTHKQLLHMLVSSVLCFTSIVASATPMIWDLKATPIEPLGIAIDFTVSDVTADDEVKLLEVSMAANGTNYVAMSLLGETNCVNGAHRVYWNMAADGLTFDPMPVSLKVAYEYPLYCVIDISGGSSAASYSVTYMNTEPKGGFNKNEYKTTKLVLKRVNAGTFIMGEDQTDEAHRVILTKPFYLGLYEVTQKQWNLVTGTNVSSWTSLVGMGDTYPAYYVSYDMIRGVSNGASWPSSSAVDADSFLGKLQEKTGLAFDLPTEAQWEYACRAGTTTKYSYGDSYDYNYMNCYKSSSNYAKYVGTLKANPWGFYDMHGNVCEWCLDRYGTLLYGLDPYGLASGSRRVYRGGSWNDSPYYATSFYRQDAGESPSASNSECGFRLSWTRP